MPKYDVQIEGTSFNNDREGISEDQIPFTVIIEVDAENEQDARKKAEELCLKPGPQGALYKYDQDPKDAIWNITKVTRKQS